MKKSILEFDPLLAAPLIMKWEGLRLKAYKCPADRWTIGYGHTAGVQPGEVITRPQADKILLDDLIGFQDDLASLVKVKVTEGMFIAMMSFIFNFGLSKCRSYSLFKELNKGHYREAAEWFPKYVYSGSVKLGGLVNRRNEELMYFKRDGF